MATLLLVVIYTAFISLGIPDSLFGTAWPAIYVEFNLPISYANFISLLISTCTLISSMLSARVINRFGTANVSAASTLMTALALLGNSFAPGFFWLCVFSVPLGLGAGAIDSALNNYVALHYKATHMSFLHCFYGIGVAISPYLMSLALKADSDWRLGYRTAFCIQAAICAITIFSLPLWKKVKHASALSNEAEKPKTVPLFKLFKRSDVRAAAIAFFASCAIEFLCGIWGSTFLVEARGMAADEAAKMLTFYYIGMALGRFLSGIFANKFSSRQIIFAGECVLLAAIVLILIPQNSIISAFGLFLIGMGNGPIYPNMMYLTPHHFGADISQSVMGAQVTGAYVGILLVPFIFGIVAEHVGMWLFSVFLLAMYVIMVVYIIILENRVKSRRIKE